MSFPFRHRHHLAPNPHLSPSSTSLAKVVPANTPSPQITDPAFLLRKGCSNNNLSTSTPLDPQSSFPLQPSSRHQTTLSRLPLSSPPPPSPRATASNAPSPPSPKPNSPASKSTSPRPLLHAQNAFASHSNSSPRSPASPSRLPRPHRLDSTSSRLPRSDFPGLTLLLSPTPPTPRSPSRPLCSKASRTTRTSPRVRCLRRLVLEERTERGWRRGEKRRRTGWIRTRWCG